mmetsp:Transcript_54357/g.100383  ORF Transcript_54357/g.100383 Transcript_54357/m.100383 type:complete len:217 (-) Transcript_54357:265-915(-)
MRPMMTPLPTKSRTMWAMPRFLAAVAAAFTQAEHLLWKESASSDALLNQRTTSACCSRSSAKLQASSCACAIFVADFPALLALARPPCKAPMISSGQTTAVSFLDDLIMTKVPPSTEKVYLARFWIFGTSSAQRPTSTSSPAAVSPVEASEASFASADALPASLSAGSKTSLAWNTSNASEVLSRSAVESTMTVLMHPAMAPKPKSIKLLHTTVPS